MSSQDMNDCDLKNKKSLENQRINIKIVVFRFLDKR